MRKKTLNCDSQKLEKNRKNKLLIVENCLEIRKQTRADKSVMIPKNDLVKNSDKQNLVKIILCKDIIISKNTRKKTKF